LLNKTNYRDRIKESINDVLGLKKMKRELLVHTEFADMHDKEMLRYYVEMMGSVVDSIGMNEDELESVCEVFGRKMNDKHADSVYLNANWLYSRLGVKRLVVHTRKYSISLSKGNAEDERNAMLFAGLGAATRAHKGNFSSVEEIEETNRMLDVDEESIKEEEILNKVVKMDKGIGRFKNGKVIFVPVKYCENPVNTVGLGDCFTACNIALISS
jgi:ADP-dependent phosphofructokinase/glucokinase